MAGGFGRLGGDDASGGGATIAGGLGALVEAKRSAEGGGGSFDGATMGAEVAMGSGIEGGNAVLTSKGCVTAAWAPWAVGRSTRRSDVVGRLTRTGASVPSGKVGRPGGAMTPDLGGSLLLWVSAG